VHALCIGTVFRGLFLRIDGAGMDVIDTLRTFLCALRDVFDRPVDLL
jgi:hypothetical protein